MNVKNQQKPIERLRVILRVQGPAFIGVYNSKACHLARFSRKPPPLGRNPARESGSIPNIHLISPFVLSKLRQGETDQLPYRPSSIRQPGRHTCACAALQRGASACVAGVCPGTFWEAVYFSVSAVERILLPGSRDNGQNGSTPATIRGVPSIRSCTAPVPRSDEFTKQELVKKLEEGAVAAGFPTEQWTQARVKKVIEREFGVVYHQNYICRWLDDLRWSVQKPDPRAIERDEDLIRTWLKQD